MQFCEQHYIFLWGLLFVYYKTTYWLVSAFCSIFSFKIPKMCLFFFSWRTHGGSWLFLKVLHVNSVYCRVDCQMQCGAQGICSSQWGLCVIVLEHANGASQCVEDREGNSKVTLWLRRGAPRKFCFFLWVALQCDIIDNEGILEKSPFVVGQWTKFCLQKPNASFLRTGVQGAGRGSCVFKTLLVIPNFIMKVYSTELHLQKESQHVVESTTRKCKCCQARCWFLSNAVYSDR